MSIARRFLTTPENVAAPVVELGVAVLLVLTYPNVPVALLVAGFAAGFAVVMLFTGIARACSAENEARRYRAIAARIGKFNTAHPDRPFVV